MAIGQETVEHHRLSHSRLKKQSTIRDGNEIQDKDALETDSDSRSSTESATLTGSSKSSKKPKATRDKKVEKSSASSSISRRATNIDFGGNEDDHKDENDFFVEVIIDELKKENRELKFTLMSREEQLQVDIDRSRFAISRRKLSVNSC